MICSPLWNTKKMKYRGKKGIKPQWQVMGKNLSKDDTFQNIFGRQSGWKSDLAAGRRYNSNIWRNHTNEDELICPTKVLKLEKWEWELRNVGMKCGVKIKRNSWNLHKGFIYRQLYLTGKFRFILQVMGSRCLMGTEFQLQWWKSCGDGQWWQLYNITNVLNGTESYA